ncbi:hypothetical protein HDU98_005824 [Podochytrium sp. JEL0797]|nr:hypothetical protein HDU98_005824 [Podochytrium sp. JEL0797]
MRAVIQRVKQASVTVDNRLVSEIGNGICVLIGITTDDTPSDAEFIAKKLTSLRLWDGQDGKPWKLNVKDAGFEILSVSQFTLYAVTNKGAKPDFHKAMKGEFSQPFYNDFLAKLRSLHSDDKVKDGEFGAMMDVALFGKFIQGQQTEWAGPQYLNYKALKKVINAVEALAESAQAASGSSQPVLLATVVDVTHMSEFQALKTAFFFKLERELEKVNAFYLQKESEFKVRLRSLVDKKKVLKGRKSSQNLAALVTLMEAFASFQQDLAKLQKFVEVNGEGFRKILKKWDKRAKSTTKELYLSRQVEIQPCFNNDVLTEFTDSATTNIAEIEAYIEHGDFAPTPVNDMSSSKPVSSAVFGQVSESMNDLEMELVTLMNAHGPQHAHGLDDIRDFLVKRKESIHNDDREFFSRVYLRVLPTAPSESISLLLGQDVVDCNYIDDINNRTCVHEAAISGRLDVLKMSVEVGGGNIESLDVYGRKPLHYAAMHGKLECLTYIASQPTCDINLLDLDGFTALTYSIIGGFTDCVKQCLERFASVDPATTMTSSSLSLACEHGHTEIATLLLSRGASLVLNSDGLSPLHLAARAGHADLLSLLIKHGGDVDMVDIFQSWTPLFYAASEGHIESVKLLLAAGCSKTVKDETDWNAWTYALYHGHMEVAKLLEIVGISRKSPAMAAVSFSKVAEELQPMRPSALFTAEISTNVMVEDLDMEELPSLSLPPPIIPFRIYGHNYLDSKYLVQLNLSSFTSEASNNSPIKLFGSRQLSSLKLIISNKPDCEIPYNVILPLTDDSEPFAFFVSDPKEIALQFDIYPTFGTKILGRSVVLASQLINVSRKWGGSGENELMVAPLFDSYLRVVGELRFSFTVVNPFIHPRLQIGGKVETYWKSTMVVNAVGPNKGHTESGIQSLITASSLVHEYVNIVVQMTRDGVPVVYPSWFLRANEASGVGVNMSIGNLLYEEAARIFKALKSARSPISAMQTDSGFSSNTELAASIYDSFMTLEEVLKNTPASVGISVELKYPTQSERETLVMPFVPSINSFLDGILKTVYDNSANRSIIFSSFNPQVCVTMNWKQPNFGVFFKTNCGITAPGETWTETDRRCGSIKEAIRFSKRSNFLGIMCDAAPLIHVPALITTIKQSGLMLASFGSSNQIASNVAVQEAGGVDGIMIGQVLNYSVNPITSQLLNGSTEMSPVKPEPLPSTSRVSGSPQAPSKVGRQFYVNPGPDDQFVNFDPPIIGPPWIRNSRVYSILFLPYLFVLRLIQENSKLSKNPFVDNTVRTARYTVIDFIPKQLLAQFSKVANIYFFIVSMLQIIPGVSPTGRFTTIFPLSFFVLVSMIKEAYDDFFRYKQDAAENNSPVQRLVVSGPGLVPRGSMMRRFTQRGSTPTGASPGSGPAPTAVGAHAGIEMQQLVNPASIRGKSGLHVGEWEQIHCKDIRVGDVILIRDREFIPADMVVIWASNDDGVCFVETSNLDGETNLKQRQALKVTADAICDVNSMANFRARIHTEGPSGDLYNFDGFLQDDEGNRYPLTPNQLLQRGATLRNTKEIFGVAVFTGEESKIRMNSYAPPSTKMSHLGRITNKVIVMILCSLLLFSALGTMAYALWDTHERKDGFGFVRHWYLIDKSGYALIFFTFLILFNAFIPISLYVTMEVVKIFQVYFMMNDLAMYDAERDIPAQANTSSLNEDLGQVQYVFSDKTGTLTENVMEFRVFSVAGKSITHPACPPRTDGSLDVAPILEELAGAKSRGEELTPSQNETFCFLEAMALCHTVIPDLTANELPPFQSNEKLPASPPTAQSIVYQSSFADEVAIVNAARDMSFVYKARTPTTLTLNILNQPADTEYELLNIVEFSSDRKRMSAIYRYPDGRIILLTKGADNVILERLKSDKTLSPEELRLNAKTLADVNAFSTEGLRTLLYAHRVLDPAAYSTWAKKYAEATTAISNRADLVAGVAEELERGLTLLGATAIEDKLQEGVPETIESLRRANIRVWMLTGDKTETAINIGRTCNLIKKDTHFMLLKDDTILSYSQQASSEIAAIQSWIDDSTKTFLAMKRENPDCHIVVTVEGRLLFKLEKHLLASPETATFERLVDLLIATDNVICCRFSPAQKALLVRKVKDRLHNQHSTPGGASPLLQELGGPQPTTFERIISTLMLRPRQSGVTLAVGDGANDIPMLLCAHVGIGITGREGLAASRASDYSIAKFRFLQPLLFVHGRWSYVRISLFILGTLYKNITFYGTQLIFQFWCGYSGTSLYEQWTLSLNNVMFTSLPVMVIGIFEKDLNRSTLIAVPELYRYGQVNRGFNFRIQLRWFFQGFLHATISVLLPAIFYGGFFNGTNNSYVNIPLFWGANSTVWVQETMFSDASGPYQESSLYPFGTISYTITILFCTIKVLYVESHNITYMHHIIGGLTFLVWIGYQFVYSLVWQPHSIFGPDTAYEYSGLSWPLVHTQLRFWGIVILTVVVGLVLEDMSLKFFELLNKLVRWGNHGGRTEVVEVPKQSQAQNNYECMSEDAKVAAMYAVGVHDWADEVAWWQFWEKTHGIGSTLFADPTKRE